MKRIIFGLMLAMMFCTLVQGANRTVTENDGQGIHRVKNSAGLSFSKDTARADVIRYSALPWFAFSEMKHAGSIQTGDSIPKISTGKLIQEKKKLLLPISISVHHGLVDGRNVAEFIQNLKDGQNNTL